MEVLSLAQFTSTGGSGLHTFELVDAPSGGSIDPQTGAYAAGASAGEVDVVRVWDADCDDSATASITVVPPLEVQPLAADIPPGTELQVQVTGGSGAHSCAINAAASGGSGGTLTDGCSYRAGPTAGTDLMEVVDHETGASELVIISVDDQHTLQVAGWGGVVLPVGSRWVPGVTGGTGEWTLSGSSGDLTIEGGAVVGTEPMDGSVQLTDRWAPGLSLQVPVQVRALRSTSLPRDGERSGEGVAIGLEDANGDGFPDAALGFTELTLGAWYSGGVVIYAGGPDGLEPEPARVIGGDDTEQTFGRAVAAADLDGDGWTELIIGADRADRGATNNGLVFIYDGVPGSFFSDEPGQILEGPHALGRMGSALAVCDFNGDGAPDLAVGARDDADENVAVPAEAQGAVHIFLGAGGTFSDEADLVLYGVVPEGEDWASQAGMSLGIGLAAGDLNGDGLCDLAAGAPEADGEAGAVLVWTGSAEPGEGLNREPAAFFAGPEDGELGRRVAIGDVDGDGTNDLWMSAWKADGHATGAGAVWGFSGAGLRLDGAEVPLSEASWQRLGTTSYQRVGTDIALHDLDGDGHADVIIGAYRDEVGTGVNEGTVTVFDGATIAATPGHDATYDLPWMTIEGHDGEDRLGQAVGAVGDLTGDGIGDLIALAGYDSAYGINTGAPYFLRGEDDAAPELLELPGVAGGHGIGGSMAWMDLNADGHLDLLSSAPEAGDSAVGSNAGQLLVWWGSDDGLSELPSAFAGGHETHDATDRFAHAVRDIGDFDGDGFSDLAVVARKDSRPSSFDPELFANPDACPGTRTQSGAVYIYRGQADGVSATPSFVWFGPDAYGYVQQVEGGFDRDGDGYTDLAVASTEWDVGGGVAIIRGRPATDTTEVICDTELYLADTRYDRLGSSLAPMPDLDGDGCDELVVGASGAESADGATNQGLIRLFWGTCGEAWSVTTLGLDIPGAEVGSALATGADLDGDGLPDLAVGASAYEVERTEVGGAWLVPGAHLLALEADPHTEGSLPIEPTVQPLLDEGGWTARMGVLGTEAGAQLGTAVGFLPPTDGAPPRLAVGAPFSSAGGTDYSGAVWIYAWDDPAAGGSGFQPVPWGLVVGDASSGESQLGSSLTTHPDTPVWLVGVPRSNAGDLDGGALLTLDW